MSLTQYTYLYTSADNGKISISEKIDRITELQNPDLIDLEQLQYLANNLGYNVDLNRGDLGITIPTELSADTSADEVGKYLRFVVENLPEWYRTKTTRSSVRTMLLSFGIVGDITTYYTKNYLPESQGGIWTSEDYDLKGSELTNIPNSFYPTPHFTLWADLDQSTSSLIWDFEKREQLIRAIDSIKPINTVFRNLSAFVKRYVNVKVAAWARFNRYIRIESDTASDFWV